MLESCKTAKERWGGVNDIIDSWLTERQHLISLFCKLSTHLNSSNHAKLISEIQSFCQIMVDYVSAGHFEVYGQLLEEGNMFDDGGPDLAKDLLLRIEATTEVALNFNDKFDTEDHCSEFIDGLTGELSIIGELLEERFELEDQLVDILHTVHAELVA